MLFVVILVMPWFTGVMLKGTEPVCLSRYDYDYKVLRDIVTMETKLKRLKNKMDAQSDMIEKQERVIAEMMTSHDDAVRKLERQIKDTTFGSGSTFVRWGRFTCPENGTTTVYSGYAAGSWYDHSGAAANTICLPSQPVWGKYEDKLQGYTSYIYGAEYEFTGTRDEALFKKDVYNQDVPCAVCRSDRTSLLMIPGRNACYDGWSSEYTGYLVAGYYSHSAASEYLCMDEDPEVVTGGAESLNGKLFYVTEARCGSLKCPPYVEGRELTCVVCSL